MVVVLPAPLGPSKPKNSPVGTDRSSPSSATIGLPGGRGGPDGSEPGGGGAPERRFFSLGAA